MPISREKFESYAPAEHRTNAERVRAFLRKHPEQAFKAREIAEAAGVDEGSIHPVLGRLAEGGSVEHKSPYWALADEDDPENHRNGGRRHGRGDRDGTRDRDQDRDHDRSEWPKSAVRRHRAGR